MDISTARALVTGGARGLGRCFVEQLVEAGAAVAFCDVAGVEEAAEQTGATGLVADVSKEDDVARLFAEAEEALGGPVDVLVNNAGIIRDGLLAKKDRKTGEVQTLSKSKWDAVIAVNLTGPFLCAREMAKRLIETGAKGVIVNVSSISRHGNRGQSNYSAAKAGLAADTRLWAVELGRYGIRVGAIAPGFTRTDMVASMRPEIVEKMVQPIPLQRMAEPFEQWQAVRFILECDYFTGRVVEVDGGLSL